MKLSKDQNESTESRDSTTNTQTTTPVNPPNYRFSIYNSPWSSARKRKRRKQLFSKSREEQLVDEITLIIPSVLKTLEKTGLREYFCLLLKGISYGTFSVTRLVIGTSRTVGSAKKFVRITSGFGGGEFTKTLRKVCTCQKLKFSFLLLEYCKIRECYAVANAFTIRNMYSLFLYMKCNSRKINRPTKNMTKIVTLLHF